MSLADQLREIREGMSKDAPKKKKPERKERVTPWQYLKEVRHEIAKVTWPKREDVVRGTVSVIVISALTALLLGVFDLLSQIGLERLIENRDAANQTTEQNVTTDVEVPTGDSLDINQLKEQLPEGVPLPEGLDSSTSTDSTGSTP